VPASQATRDATEFIMLKNGGIYFEGLAGEFLASPDPYLRTFLAGWIPPVVA
jgi:ABC-type transporter Mla maintaining outer membrane lipid asymmetry ATPase subunit MlaF